MSKFESSSVVKEFQNQIQAHLPDSNIRVIAGVSGGSDSMAMLYLLHCFDLETIVVHCNYQLRSEASDKDQQLVEEICMHWKLECVSLRFDSIKQSTGNFQDWARNRRYEAFRDLKKEYDADLILTAHHQDDQLETIIQKILRGSGIPSWKGMRVQEKDLFRPLLNLSKSDIIEFVEKFNVPYRIDRTNEESTYARNFIRNHWFQGLNKFFPGWEENVKKISDRAEEFSLMSDLILEQVCISESELDRKKFLGLNHKIKPAILLRFIKKNTVHTKISQGFLESINGIDELQSGGKRQISDDYYLYRDRDFFKVVDESSRIEIHQQIEKYQMKQALIISDWQFEIRSLPKNYSETMLHLDMERIKYPVTLRNWQDGDSFQPLGLDGTQLISDHLTNRKIPSSIKRQALVVESFDRTICAVIFPNYSNTIELGTVSEKFRCSSVTTETLIITKTNKHGSVST